jgi:hypothetical protein
MIKDVVAHWLDLTANLQQGIMPVHLIERPPIHDQGKAWAGSTEIARDGEFYVPQLDCYRLDPLWVVTKSGTHVRVPVHGYLTRARSLAAIFGVGLEIGLAFMESFRNHSTAAVQEVHLVLGNDCTDLALEGRDAFRCYVGLAIKT